MRLSDVGQAALLVGALGMSIAPSSNRPDPYLINTYLRTGDVESYRNYVKTLEQENTETWFNITTGLALGGAVLYFAARVKEIKDSKRSE